MALTDLKVRAAKAGIKPDGSSTDKSYRLSDSGGLYLEVSPRGGKWWRLKYRFAGKEKRLSLGTYPSVSLKEVRLERDEMKKLLTNNIDPSDERKLKKLTSNIKSENTFMVIGREWYSKHSTQWSNSYRIRTESRLEKDVYPFIGERDINEITAPELLSVLRRVEERGAIETAHRIRRLSSQIFRYAIVTGRGERDTAADLVGAIPPPSRNHFSTIVDPKLIGQLLRDIDQYWGTFIVKSALKFSPLVFQRPGEIRHAEWSEIDFDIAEWRIPDHKMKEKGRNVHIVPLSQQAMIILRDVQQLTGNGKYIFPANHTTKQPMSENTINQAIRRLGYSKDDMTAHGFRAMASTLLNEQGWNSDAIERQLAHVESNEVRRAYNHAKHLDERRKMMQAWADYLDGLKNGAEIVPIRASNN